MLSAHLQQMAADSNGPALCVLDLSGRRRRRRRHTQALAPPTGAASLGFYIVFFLNSTELRQKKVAIWRIWNIV